MNGRKEGRNNVRVERGRGENKRRVRTGEGMTNREGGRVRGCGNQAISC